MTKQGVFEGLPLNHRENPAGAADTLLAKNAKLRKRCEELTDRCDDLEKRLVEQTRKADELQLQVRQMAEDHTNRNIRRSDPDTSFDAEKANRVYRKEQVQQFVQVFKEAGHGGLTDEQAHDAVGLKSHTPRVADMKRVGLLVATGERRQTKSGRGAKVYRLSQFAWEIMNDGTGKEEE